MSVIVPHPPVKASSGGLELVYSSSSSMLIQPKVTYGSGYWYTCTLYAFDLYSDGDLVVMVPHSKSNANLMIIANRSGSNSTASTGSIPSEFAPDVDTSFIIGIGKQYSSSSQATQLLNVKTSGEISFADITSGNATFVSTDRHTVYHPAFKWYISTETNEPSPH